MKRPVNLPQSISDFVAGYNWNEMTIGGSSARTFCLKRHNHPSMYLKIEKKQPRRDLLEEKLVLEWLLDKLPVANVLFFNEDDGSDYLITSEIPGANAADSIGGIDNTELAVLLAKGLRMIHEVTIKDCPFDKSLNKDIENAEFNVKHNLVEEKDFDAIRHGRTSEELYKELLLLKPAKEDLVFTHGDYCLPNIMIHQARIAGFIDLSRAGVADRYKDIALAVRSIRRNLGTGFEHVFLTEYGLTKPELQKIDYYMLLDEFF